ncbi:hypothetical protein I306_02666 [Cryptococcus gattii EJB2]|uniref:Carboxylesterase type B domain-containing protein n=1 Tax=Cryptococcus gattii EJB2 TaxID=1296103 RepID=A0ABR5BXF1_9TREE|nr:hypothetical protein I306_02666 [Cryptococcus gattii EJB2]
MVSYVKGPTIDGDLITDPPHTLLSQGQFANKPFITGNNKDEGTRFVPIWINGTIFGLDLINLAEPVDPSNVTLAELITVYPNDPSLGSPFDTGNETFGLDPSFKQFAAINGDAQFQSPRRHFLQQANKYGNNYTWTYQFEQLTPGAPRYLGSYHGSEIIYVFGGVKSDLATSAGSNARYSDADQKLSEAMMTYWYALLPFSPYPSFLPNQFLSQKFADKGNNYRINFAHHHNPNGNSDSGPTGSANGTYWPPYEDNFDNRNMLRLKSDNITVFRDDYREKGVQFFLDHPKEFNARRRWLPTTT